VARERDYAAEYRRRLERARERGVTDKAAARGHRSREAENAARRAKTERERKERAAKDRKNAAARARRALLGTVRSLAREGEALGLSYEDHGDRYGVLNDAVRELGVSWTVARLRTQIADTEQYSRLNPVPGHNHWVARDRDKDEILWYYHGYY